MSESLPPKPFNAENERNRVFVHKEKEKIARETNIPLHAQKNISESDKASNYRKICQSSDKPPTNITDTFDYKSSGAEDIRIVCECSECGQQFLFSHKNKKGRWTAT